MVLNERADVNSRKQLRQLVIGCLPQIMSLFVAAKGREEQTKDRLLFVAERLVNCCDFCERGFPNLLI
jgi:hypothetical protein